MDSASKTTAQGESKSNPVVGKHPLRLELSMKDLEAILEHARSALSEEEFATLRGAMQTLEFLTRELEKKSVSIQRLKQLLFGAATEKTRKVIEKILEHATPAPEAGAMTGKASAAEKPKGHGRNGAGAYSGATRIRVSLAKLHAGDACPECVKGTLYASPPPRLIVRVTGQAPIGGKIYELQRLRCCLCGAVFTAEPPEGVGEEKYDAASAAMIALLKYGAGLPFHRLENLQAGLGIPLPAATQWEIVSETAVILVPAWRELIHQAAQGEVLHNDDTTMKVLALENSTAEVAASTTEPGAVVAAEPATSVVTEPAVPTAQSAGETSATPSAENGADHTEARNRTGVFTSGIISKAVDHTIALFFTGHKHAGENLLDLLRQRCAELDPPIQMCDALSRNMPPELRTIIANCLALSRVAAGIGRLSRESSASLGRVGPDKSAY